MKKLLLLLLVLNFIALSAWSQLKQDIIKKRMEPQTKTAPTTSQPSTPAPVYSMTAARVSIRTGTDNKEFPSTLYVEIWQKGHPGFYYQPYCLYKVHNLKNEMKINSTTDLGLERIDGAAEKFLLSTIQKNGLELDVAYNPNFFMDAWKIENITFTLEFKDQYGNLHPTLGSKIINFTNASGFLNNDYHVFKCITDVNMNPLTASIEKNQ